MDTAVADYNSKTIDSTGYVNLDKLVPRTDMYHLSSTHYPVSTNTVYCFTMHFIIFIIIIITEMKN